MKKAFTIALFAFAFLTAAAGDWTLLWDDPNPAGSILRSEVTHIDSASKTNTYQTSATQLKLPLTAGTHRFSVLFVATNLVTSDSARLDWVIPKAAINLRLEFSVTIPSDPK